MDIFYTDTDQLPYRSQPTGDPTRSRSSRGLRNWQKFTMVYTLLLSGLALQLGDLVLRTGGNMAGFWVVVPGVGVVGCIAGLIDVGWAAKDGRL